MFARHIPKSYSKSSGIQNTLAKLYLPSEASTKKKTQIKNFSEILELMV